MPIERYYLPGPLAAGQEYFLAEAEHHHLAHVTRIKEGEKVELVNGQGTLALAQVLAIGRREARLLVAKVEVAPPPPCETILIQAIPRINRLSTIVEKATELGATALWLFPGDRSEKKLSPSQLTHAGQVAVSAMKQCGRLDLPSIIEKPPLVQWETLPERTYYGDISPTAPSLLTTWDGRGDVAFCIGPESGFSDKEVARLLSLGAKGISLHGNILRTDTAPIVALALASARRGQTTPAA